MNIEIRLFATFRNGRGKKLVLEQMEPTPRSLLCEIGITEEDVAILLINGQDGNFDQTLTSGDYISVFPPVGGG
ncbi:MoaD/ThiS family protein [Serpentinicella alkaliphila]|uniref:Sulfur carrier protein n=1 Tax=Serpentinicella alkaliphila TaxID=1734049 RepID=A0A4R2TVX9_9FIRM|nr:MoaD/ThiS family protein [Serpentinicella alkaliphila]QUH26852.1 MoaD/ThiS family protein [Serpentinicella alkaliphila]TCQ08081.1 sulfur carrier protein [Serpentinicella alkaliphila]